MRKKRTPPLAGAAIVLVLLSACPLFVLLQPASFRIARTRVIATPPARIHAELADVRRLAAWEPRLGPVSASRAATAFSATTTGPGAWVEWRSSDGTSRATITSTTPSRIELRNDVAGATTGGTSRTVFELAPAPTGTEVTWAFEGDNDLLRRVLWPVAGLESRLSPDIDAALLRLEAATRSP